jgi:N-acetylglucosaminyldiphosphoundecaprenol N-acetyl-beta-D-mannosaminyltransferase
MKLLLAGYYGSGNIGDEAILQALLSEIRKVYPYGITVLSENPHETSMSCNVNSVHKYSVFKILKELKTSDAFILGGGGILQDSTSARSFLYYVILILLAKCFKKKVVLLGQGIGPVRNKFLLKRAFKNIDLVTVRDEKSLKELTRIGAKPQKLVLTADLSFLLGSPNKEKGKKLLDIDGVKKCRPRLIGVSLRPPVKGKESISKYKAIAAACDHLIKEKDSQVVFLIFKYPDDIDVTNKVMSYMKYPAHVLLRRCTPSEMLDIISGIDGLIGMRLHSLIFSAIAKVKSLGLSYDPKVESFQRIVGNPLIDFNGIDAGRLISEADKFIENLSVKSAYGIEQLINKADENIKLLVECLKNNRIKILGVEIDDLSMEQAVRKAEEILESKIPGMIVTPNSEMIMAAQKDIELKGIVNNASISIADGVGLIIAGRILGKKIRQRLTGIDLMLKIADLAREKGYRLFLLGGKEGVAGKAAENLKADVAGTLQGYSMNDHLVTENIKSSKPDILFVGLGSPKQEKWAAKHLKELNVPLVMCVGGSFDVISGKVKRSPLLMRRLGIEWFWRLIMEPRRWRRMLVLPVFILKVIRSRF